MSWFNILKLDPLQQQQRMRERVQGRSPAPTAEVSEEVCAICGSKNFMRGSVNSKGQKNYKVVHHSQFEPNFPFKLNNFLHPEILSLFLNHLTSNKTNIKRHHQSEESLFPPLSA